MHAQELFSCLDEYLQLEAVADYGTQGLQVDAQNDKVERIALAVDTAPDTIIAAAAWRADMMLVHRGILWRTVEPIVGTFGRRVRLLLENHIRLCAAHLTLDAHPEIGNNAVLARTLELQNIE